MKRSFLRCTSLLVVAAFLCQEIGNAANSIHLTSPLSASGISNAWNIPESIARIDDVYQGDQDTPTVILFSDAHTNYSAQMNLAKAMHKIMKSEKIEWAFTEAAVGDNSIRFLRELLSDQKEINSIADSYLHKSKINGVEYLNLTSDHDFKIWGVEDKELYLKSLQTYTNILQKKQSLMLVIHAAEKLFKTLESRILNPDLLNMHQAKVKYSKDELTTVDYLLNISSLREKYLNGQDNQISVIHRLIQIKQMEDSINFEEAGMQLSQLLELGEDVANIGETKRISHHQTDQIKSILRLLNRNEEYLKQNTSLKKYAEYINQFTSIDLRGFEQERLDLEDELVRRISRTSEEIQFVQYHDALNRIRKLVDLKLTSEDYRQVVNNSEVHNPDRIFAFLNGSLIKHGLSGEHAIFSDYVFNRSLQESKSFYELTLQRDEAFRENMLKVMNRDGIQKACLIVGGYHAENLKQNLRQLGYSYVSVIPTVEHETNNQRYENILLNQIQSDTYRQYAKTQPIQKSTLMTLYAARKGFGVPLTVYEMAEELGGNKNWVNERMAASRLAVHEDVVEYVRRLRILHDAEVLQGRVLYPAIGHDYLPSLFAEVTGVDLYDKNQHTAKDVSTLNQLLFDSGIPEINDSRVNVISGSILSDEVQEKIKLQPKFDVLYLKSLNTWVDAYKHGSIDIGRFSKKEITTELKNWITYAVKEYLQPNGRVVIAYQADRELFRHLIDVLGFAISDVMEINEETKELPRGDLVEIRLSGIYLGVGAVPLIVLERPILESATQSASRLAVTTPEAGGSYPVKLTQLDAEGRDWLAETEKMGKITYRVERAGPNTTRWMKQQAIALGGQLPSIAESWLLREENKFARALLRASIRVHRIFERTIGYLFDVLFFTKSPLWTDYTDAITVFITQANTDFVVGYYVYYPKIKTSSLVVVSPKYRGSGAVDVLFEDMKRRIANGDDEFKHHTKIYRASERVPFRKMGDFYGTISERKKTLGIKSDLQIVAYVDPSEIIEIPDKPLQYSTKSMPMRYPQLYDLIFEYLDRSEPDDELNLLLMGAGLDDRSSDEHPASPQTVEILAALTGRAARLKIIDVNETVHSLIQNPKNYLWYKAHEGGRFLSQEFYDSQSYDQMRENLARILINANTSDFAWNAAPPEEKVYQIDPEQISDIQIESVLSEFNSIPDYGNATQDIIVSTVALAYDLMRMDAEQRNQFMGRIARALKPNGVLIIHADEFVLIHPDIAEYPFHLRTDKILKMGFTDIQKMLKKQTGFDYQIRLYGPLVEIRQTAKVSDSLKSGARLASKNQSNAADIRIKIRQSKKQVRYIQKLIYENMDDSPDQINEKLRDKFSDTEIEYIQDGHDSIVIRHNKYPKYVFKYPASLKEDLNWYQNLLSKFIIADLIKKQHGEETKVYQSDGLTFYEIPKHLPFSIVDGVYIQPFISNIGDVSERSVGQLIRYMEQAGGTVVDPSFDNFAKYKRKTVVIDPGSVQASEMTWGIRSRDIKREETIMSDEEFEKALKKMTGSADWSKRAVSNPAEWERRVVAAYHHGIRSLKLSYEDAAQFAMRVYVSDSEIAKRSGARLTSSREDSLLSVYKGQQYEYTISYDDFLNENHIPRFQKWLNENRIQQILKLPKLPSAIFDTDSPHQFNLELSTAFTEMMMNAFNAVVDRFSSADTGSDIENGKVQVRVYVKDNQAVIEVEDNGQTVNLNERGRPIARNRGIRHVGGDGRGVPFMLNFSNAYEGKVEWIPTTNGTVTRLLLPINRMPETFIFDDSESIAIKKEAKKAVSLFPKDVSVSAYAAMQKGLSILETLEGAPFFFDADAFEESELELLFTDFGEFEYLRRGGERFVFRYSPIDDFVVKVPRVRGKLTAYFDLFKYQAIAALTKLSGNGSTEIIDAVGEKFYKIPQLAPFAFSDGVFIEPYLDEKPEEYETSRQGLIEYYKEMGVDFHDNGLKNFVIYRGQPVVYDIGALRINSEGWNKLHANFTVNGRDYPTNDRIREVVTYLSGLKDLGVEAIIHHPDILLGAVMYDAMSKGYTVSEAFETTVLYSQKIQSLGARLSAGDENHTLSSPSNYSDETLAEFILKRLGNGNVIDVGGNGDFIKLTATELAEQGVTFNDIYSMDVLSLRKIGISEMTGAYQAETLLGKNFPLKRLKEEPIAQALEQQFSLMFMNAPVLEGASLGKGGYRDWVYNAKFFGAEDATLLVRLHTDDIHNSRIGRFIRTLNGSAIESTSLDGKIYHGPVAEMLGVVPIEGRNYQLVDFYEKMPRQMLTTPYTRNSPVPLLEFRRSEPLSETENKALAQKILEMALSTQNPEVRNVALGTLNSFEEDIEEIVGKEAERLRKIYDQAGLNLYTEITRSEIQVLLERFGLSISGGRLANIESIKIDPSDEASRSAWRLKFQESQGLGPFTPAALAKQKRSTADQFKEVLLRHQLIPENRRQYTNITSLILNPYELNAWMHLLDAAIQQPDEFYEAIEPYLQDDQLRQNEVWLDIDANTHRFHATQHSVFLTHQMWSDPQLTLTQKIAMTLTLLDGRQIEGRHTFSQAALEIARNIALSEPEVLEELKSETESLVDNLRAYIQAFILNRVDPYSESLVLYHGTPITKDDGNEMLRRTDPTYFTPISDEATEYAEGGTLYQTQVPIDSILDVSGWGTSEWEFIAKEAPRDGKGYPIIKKINLSGNGARLSENSPDPILTESQVIDAVNEWKDLAEKNASETEFYNFVYGLKGLLNGIESQGVLMQVGAHLNLKRGAEEIFPAQDGKLTPLQALEAISLLAIIQSQSSPVSFLEYQTFKEAAAVYNTQYPNSFLKIDITSLFALVLKRYIGTERVGGFSDADEMEMSGRDFYRLSLQLRYLFGDDVWSADGSDRQQLDLRVELIKIISLYHFLHGIHFQSVSLDTSHDLRIMYQHMLFLTDQYQSLVGDGLIEQLPIEKIEKQTLVQALEISLNRVWASTLPFFDRTHKYPRYAFPEIRGLSEQTTENYQTYFKQHSELIGRIARRVLADRYSDIAGMGLTLAFHRNGRNGFEETVLDIPGQVIPENRNSAFDFFLRPNISFWHLRGDRREFSVTSASSTRYRFGLPEAATRIDNYDLALRSLGARLTEAADSTQEKLQRRIQKLERKTKVLRWLGVSRFMTLYSKLVSDVYESKTFKTAMRMKYDYGRQWSHEQTYGWEKVHSKKLLRNTFIALGISIASVWIPNAVYVLIPLALNSIIQHGYPVLMQQYIRTRIELMNAKQELKTVKSEGSPDASASRLSQDSVAENIYREPYQLIQHISVIRQWASESKSYAYRENLSYYGQEADKEMQNRIFAITSPLFHYAFYRMRETGSSQLPLEYSYEDSESGPRIDITLKSFDDRHHLFRSALSALQSLSEKFGFNVEMSESGSEIQYRLHIPSQTIFNSRAARYSLTSLNVQSYHYPLVLEAEKILSKTKSNSASSARYLGLVNEFRYEGPEAILTDIRYRSDSVDSVRFVFDEIYINALNPNGPIDVKVSQDAENWVIEFENEGQIDFDALYSLADYYARHEQFRVYKKKTGYLVPPDSGNYYDTDFHVGYSRIIPEDEALEILQDMKSNHPGDILWVEHLSLKSITAAQILPAASLRGISVGGAGRGMLNALREIQKIFGGEITAKNSDQTVIVSIKIPMRQDEISRSEFKTDGARLAETESGKQSMIRSDPGGLSEQSVLSFSHDSSELNTFLTDAALQQKSRIQNHTNPELPIQFDSDIFRFRFQGIFDVEVVDFESRRHVSDITLADPKKSMPVPAQIDPASVSGAQPESISVEQAVNLDVTISENIVSLLSEYGIRLQPVNFVLNADDYLNMFDEDQRRTIAQNLMRLFGKMREERLASFSFEGLSAEKYGLKDFEPFENAPVIRFWNLNRFTDTPSETAVNLPYFNQSNGMIPMYASVTFAAAIAKLRDLDTIPAELLNDLTQELRKLTRSDATLNQDTLQTLWNYTQSFGVGIYELLSVKPFAFRGFIDASVYLQRLIRQNVDISA